MTLKSNIIVLNCCPLGPKEIELWNSLFFKNSENFNFHFFSTELSDQLKGCETFLVHYDQVIFHDVSSLDFKTNKALIREIALHDRIWECYRENESERQAFSWFVFWIMVIKLYSPDSVIIWNGYHIPEAALSRAADLLETPKYFAERGPFAGTFAFDPRGINFGSTFVNQYNHLTAVENSDAIARFANEYFGEGDSNWKQPLRVKDQAAFRARYQIPEEKVIVLFPAQVERDTNSKLFSPEFASVYDAYTEIASQCNQHFEEVFLIAKKHPLQEDAENFADVPLKSGVWIEDAHLFDCIRCCDAVISINSSAAVEAVLLGRPILLLGQSILTPNKSVLKICSRGELQGSFVKLLEYAKSREKVIDKQYLSRLLYSYLYTTEPKYVQLGIKDIAELTFKQGSYSRKHAATLQDVRTISSLIPLFDNDIRQVQKEKSGIEQQLEDLKQSKLYKIRSFFNQIKRIFVRRQAG